MSGCAPKPPSLDELRTLLSGARQMGGSRGAVLELCILTLCLPWEAVAIRMEAIDWRSGIATVPARGYRGRTRIVAIPSAALEVVMRVGGTPEGVGQAVTAGRGNALHHRDVRLDRLRDGLLRTNPDPAALDIDWNFHGIRTAGVTALAEADVPDSHIMDTIGLAQPRRESWFVRPRGAVASATAEIWCRLLATGSGPTSSR